MRAPGAPTVLLLALCAANPVPIVAAERDDLWQWQNPAPIVALVEIDGEARGAVLARTRRVFIGELPVDAALALDVREANREREPGADALDVRVGRRYVALLALAERRPRRLEVPLYRIVRGTEGMRAIPAEGSEAWIDAISKVAAIRRLGADALVWEGLGALLLDPNPLLVRTALEAHVAFGRGGPELLPAVRVLLRDPRPDVRSLASALAGVCLGRVADGEEDDSSREVSLALVGIARTDEEPAVRASAVRALGARVDAATTLVLQEIAAKDPEQEVRYEARRILYEHGLEAGGSSD